MERAAGGRYGGTYHGPEAVAEQVFSAIAAEYDGFQVIPHRYVDGKMVRFTDYHDTETVQQAFED